MILKSSTLRILSFVLCRFERSQSDESARPSIWQRFKSFEDCDVIRRSAGAGPFTAGGTLPRPRATVKPLPASAGFPEDGGAEQDPKTAAEFLKPLADMRKPDFSSAEEGTVDSFLTQLFNIWITYSSKML